MEVSILSCYFLPRLHVKNMINKPSLPNLTIIQENDFSSVTYLFGKIYVGFSQYFSLRITDTTAYTNASADLGLTISAPKTDELRWSSTGNLGLLSNCTEIPIITLSTSDMYRIMLNINKIDKSTKCSHFLTEIAPPCCENQNLPTEVYRAFTTLAWRRSCPI